MNVCIISKFPPIQGGISAKTYWMAQGIAEKGANVHVITNANCVEEEYRIDDQRPDLPENLTVHYIDPEVPWHIPSSELYVPRLLDKALEVVKDNHIDVIDTNYMIPYGGVGYLLFKITGIPYILRHGGSDIAKFLKKDIFSHLLPEVIKNASAIVTDDQNKGHFENINSNIYTLPQYIPDERFFKPAVCSRDIPIFAYIGKINHHWKYKSLDKIVELFSGIKNHYGLHFVAQGKGFMEFEEFVNNRNLKSLEFKKFVHPTNMPSLLEDVDYLLYFEKDNPIQDFSDIVCEALWSGATIITDRAINIHRYTQYTGGVSENQIIRLELEDMAISKERIKALIDQWQGPVRYNLKINYTHDRYINENIDIYENTAYS